MKKLFFFAILCAFAPTLSAQNLYWGGGSTDIPDGTPPSGTTGNWDLGTTSNWATDSIGTTYDPWTDGAIANFMYGGYDVFLSSHVTVGGLTVSGSDSGNVTIKQLSGDPRERMTFADGAIVDVDGPDALIFAGGGDEIAFTINGDLTKTGAGSWNVSTFFTNFTILAGSTFDIQEGVFSYSGNRRYRFEGSTLNIAEGAIFNDGTNFGGLNGGAKLIGALTGGGTFRGRGGSEPSNITRIGSGNLSSTFYGTIEDNSPANPMILMKDGTGIFTMAGIATYAGPTTINAGTYFLSGESTGEGTLSILDAGEMELSGTGFYSDLTFEGLDGVGTLTLHEGGLLYVLQSEYSMDDAWTDIGLGNIVGYDGLELIVSTYNDGTVDYTQVNVIPEPSTGALLLLGLAAFVFRRRLRVA